VGAVVKFVDDVGDRQIATSTTTSSGSFSATLPAGRYLIQVQAFGQDPIIFRRMVSAPRLISS